MWDRCSEEVGDTFATIYNRICLVRWLVFAYYAVASVNARLRAGRETCASLEGDIRGLQASLAAHDVPQRRLPEDALKGGGRALVMEPHGRVPFQVRFKESRRED